MLRVYAVPEPGAAVAPEGEMSDLLWLSFALLIAGALRAIVTLCERLR